MFNLKKQNWQDIKKVPFLEKAYRQVFSGDNVMLVLNTIEPGFPPFPHEHPHEQILCILEGEAKVTIGKEDVIMKGGDMVQIPPNTHHDFQVIGDKTVINLDVFYPIREDYL